MKPQELADRIIDVLARGEHTEALAEETEQATSNNKLIRIGLNSITGKPDQLITYGSQLKHELAKVLQADSSMANRLEQKLLEIAEVNNVEGDKINISGDGAVATGNDSVAIGKGGVYVGGNARGTILTGSENEINETKIIDTNTNGGDIIQGNKSEKTTLKITYKGRDGVQQFVENNSGTLIGRQETKRS